ncbi:MAG: M20/M25/M40 family metallo-hydrolase [Negativicutes bacterium]|nr:M20/M25/M40 family metallo-hydrolase [Negativicutes bacterium]
MTELGERIKTVAVELTKIRSVVGTPGEVEIAEKIYNWLQGLDYFRARPGNLELLPIPGDKLGRKNVLAVIEGQRQKDGKTLLCLGHIDTVGIDDYAELREYATNPAALKEKLPAVKFSDETLAEIASPDWIVGRGILDMKTGVAALLVMLEDFAGRAGELEGNLVFAGVPDEEGNSAGMLAAVQDLATMARSKGWRFIGAIDTDYTTSRYPGDDNRYVYIGTTGKLLPCFFLYGEETHVGEAFNGLDANLLASEVLYQLDLSTDLCDIADGEVALPPISLYQRDLKTEYSVQTANAVNLYFNYATHVSQPDAVLAKCKAKAVTSFENVIKRLNEEYEKFCALSHIPFQRLPWEVHVLTYEELYHNVKAELGEKIDRIIAATARKLRDEKVDDRDFSLAIVQEVHKHYSDKNSKIIVYFAPPYYPHIYVKDGDDGGEALLAAVNDAVDAARAVYDYNIVTRKFYPYISDLSYCGLASPEGLASLTDNMPAWSRQYTLPVEAIQTISMPVVNIGPYGKDAHKLSERVAAAYSFDAMPLILKKTMENLLIGPVGEEKEEERHDELQAADL